MYQEDAKKLRKAAKKELKAANKELKAAKKEQKAAEKLLEISLIKLKEARKCRREMQLARRLMIESVAFRARLAISEKEYFIQRIHSQLAYIPTYTPVATPEDSVENLQLFPPKENSYGNGFTHEPILLLLFFFSLFLYHMEGIVQQLTDISYQIF